MKPSTLPKPGTAAQRRTGGTFFFVLLSIAAGLLLSTQSRINGALGAALGDAITASTISFGVGLVALVLLALLSPPVRASVAQVPGALARGDFPRWYLAAGVVGALVVFSQATAIALVGVALFTVSAWSPGSASDPWPWTGSALAGRRRARSAHCACLAPC